MCEYVCAFVFVPRVFSLIAQTHILYTYTDNPCACVIVNANTNRFNGACDKHGMFLVCRVDRVYSARNAVTPKSFRPNICVWHEIRVRGLIRTYMPKLCAGNTFAHVDGYYYAANICVFV